MAGARVRRAHRSVAARGGRAPRAGAGRRANPRRGHRPQPQRSRADQRRQHGVPTGVPVRAGHGDHGGRRRRGPGCGSAARSAGRGEHEDGPRRLRRVRARVGRGDLPDARRHRVPRRRRGDVPVPPRVVGPLRPGRAPGGRDGAHPRGRGWIGLRGGAARGRPGRPRHRDGRVRGEGPALPRPRRGGGRQLHGRGLRRDRDGRHRAARGRRGVRQRGRRGDAGVDELPGLQRPLPDDGLRVGQGRARRTVPRTPAPLHRQLLSLRRAARVRARPR